MSERLCRVCHRALDPGQPAHHHSHRACLFGSRAKPTPSPADQLLQLSIYDLLGPEPEPEPEERSPFLDYMAERDRMKGAA